MPPPSNAPSAAKSAAVVVGTARPIPDVLGPAPEELLADSVAAALLHLLSQPACSETTYVARQSNNVSQVQTDHACPAIYDRYHLLELSPRTPTACRQRAWLDPWMKQFSGQRQGRCTHLQRHAESRLCLVELRPYVLRVYNCLRTMCGVHMPQRLAARITPSACIARRAVSRARHAPPARAVCGTKRRRKGSYG